MLFRCTSTYCFHVVSHWASDFFRWKIRLQATISDFQLRLFGEKCPDHQHWSLLTFLYSEDFVLWDFVVIFFNWKSPQNPTIQSRDCSVKSVRIISCRHLPTLFHRLSCFENLICWLQFMGSLEVENVAKRVEFLGGENCRCRNTG